MNLFHFKKFSKSSLPSVSFATCCWEKDWRKLLDPSYLGTKVIGNHAFPFKEKILVINNVSNEELVCSHAENLLKQGLLTHYYLAKNSAETVLDFFELKKSDFQEDLASHTPAEWLYYNAIGVLTAIFFCKSDFFLYSTGDVFLEEKISWIPQTLKKMEKKNSYKVANLVWNHQYQEAKNESYRKQGPFWIAKEGFSDQQFLVKRCDFQKPIYGQIRPDASHYPRGDVFEKRVYSFMKNQGWERIIYRKGSYTHENI